MINKKIFYFLASKNKQFFIVAIFLLSFITTVKADKRDSLQNLINTHTTNDTIKVNLLFALGTVYQDLNVDTMILLALHGYNIATSLNFEAGKANCLQLLGFAQLRKNNLDSSLSYYQLALQIYEIQKNLKEQCNIVLSMADVYYRQTKYGIAIEYYKKGISFAQQTNNNRKLGLAYMSIGGMYSDLGNNPEALQNYLKGLQFFEKENILFGISMSLSNIAAVYSAMGDLKKSEEYINKCLAITGIDKEATLNNYMNAGMVFAQMNELKKSLLYFNKALALADSIGDAAWHKATIANIGEVYYGMKEYDTALVKYSEVLVDTAKIKEDNLYLIAYKGIGKIMIKKGRIKEAITNFMKVYAYASKSQSKNELYETSGELSNAYELLGDNKKALEYHKIYYNYRDSLYNDKNDKHIQQIQFDYELDKKQSQIALLTKDNIITQSKNKVNKIIEISLICIMAALLFILFLMYRKRQYEKKVKEKLLLKNEEIQKQALKLTELNKFKDKIFSILSHDLRGPINNVSTSLLLLDQEILTEEEFAIMRPEMSKQLASLNILLDNLLKWAQTNMKEESLAQPEPILVYEIANKNVSLLQNDANSKNITINNNIPETTIVLCKAGQIDIVLRNLMNNAIKFTNHGGSITLSASTVQDKVHIAVTDTGVGMSKEKMGKLFTLTPGLSSYGTDGENGLGIGLLLCFEFMKASNGSIEVNSEINKGTTFTIILPKG